MTKVLMSLINELDEIEDVGRGLDIGLNCEIQDSNGLKDIEGNKLIRNKEVMNSEQPWL